MDNLVDYAIATKNDPLCISNDINRTVLFVKIVSLFDLLI